MTQGKQASEQDAINASKMGFKQLKKSNFLAASLFNQGHCSRPIRLKNQSVEFNFDVSKSCSDAPFPVETERRVHSQTYPASLRPPFGDAEMSAASQTGLAQLAKLYVLGPLGLFSADERNLTPRGRKTQGLLALLALAPRGQRTRVWLRDKLWSTSDEQKSASSLRQTIFELRKDLGPLADEILEINRTSIALRLDRIWIDHTAVSEDPTEIHALHIGEETELLEGMDVADEEFEDWLQMERQIWHDRAAKILASDPYVAPPLPTHDPHRGTVVPMRQNRDRATPKGRPQSDGRSWGEAHGAHPAEYVLEAVARNLQELEPSAFFAPRGTGMACERSNQVSETEYVTRVRTQRAADSLTLTFEVYRAAPVAAE